MNERCEKGDDNILTLYEAVDELKTKLEAMQEEGINPQQQTQPRQVTYVYRAAEELINLEKFGGGDHENTMATNTKPVYQRILLKLSGEALQGSEGFGIDASVLDRMA
ncbi:MAG: hypothetical protein ACTS8P_03760, partial [Arsenophonus sp. NC-XBC3-MAG3]